MSNFRSMDEFRSALNGIVAGTKKNPAQKRSKRARRNMAIRKHDGIFDTPAELIEYEKALGLGRSEEPLGITISPERSTRASRRPSTTKRGKVYKDPYAKIAVSVGGAGNLCPTVNWDLLRPKAKAAGVSAYSLILEEMGLTRQKMEWVINALDKEGVLTHGSGSRYAKSKSDQAKARKILAEVGGVVCPSARRNPWYGGY